MSSWRIGSRALGVALAVVLGTAVGASLAAFSATTSNTSSFSVFVDTTAPTISRSTVAKSDGTANTIRQGGGYYVYAQVTDDVSVASVTASVGDWDANAGTPALSFGSWTVGGQTYDYRTGLLTADTELNTGSSYSGSVTATDPSGNSRTYTVSTTVETYSGVVAGTSGLVSYWRLGDGAISADEFTDSSGTELSAHTGALDASWTEHPGQALTAVISSENRIRKATGTGGALYYSSATPPTANYRVEADVHVKSLLADDKVGVLGRHDIASGGGIGTNYQARYNVDLGQWELRRNVNGAGTLLDSYAQTLTPGQSYRLTLEMSGSTIRLLVDGVLRASAFDTSVTATGRGGIRLGDGTSTAAVTNTAGLHLDDFRITSLTTTAVDGPGTNNGTYTNGPVLNEPGALVGDSDRAARIDGINDYVTIPDAASLDLGDGPFTLEAWVKRSDADTSWSNIWQKGASAFQLGFANNKLAFAKDNIAVFAESTNTISDSSWHHLVATKNGSSYKVYIDGIDRTSPYANQTLVNTASALFFGAKNGTAEFLAATIDEFAVYNTVLSAATVLDHYNAGKGTG